MRALLFLLLGLASPVFAFDRAAAVARAGFHSVEFVDMHIGPGFSSDELEDFEIVFKKDSIIPAKITLLPDHVAPLFKNEKNSCYISVFQQPLQS